MLQRAARVVITKLVKFEIRGWIPNKRDLQRLRLQGLKMSLRTFSFKAAKHNEFYPA